MGQHFHLVERIESTSKLASNYFQQNVLFIYKGVHCTSSEPMLHYLPVQADIVSAGHQVEAGHLKTNARSSQC